MVDVCGKACNLSHLLLEIYVFRKVAINECNVFLRARTGSSTNLSGYDNHSRLLHPLKNFQIFMLGQNHKELTLLWHQRIRVPSSFLFISAGTFSTLVSPSQHIMWIKPCSRLLLRYPLYTSVQTHVRHPSRRKSKLQWQHPTVI